MPTVSHDGVRVVVLTVLLLSLVSSVAAEPKIVDLSLVKGALPKAQQVIRVQQGEDVVLRWTTDQPAAIHLHGYDIERSLVPGSPTLMPLSARLVGRFPITLHGHGQKRERTLAYLEVHPK